MSNNTPVVATAETEAQKASRVYNLTIELMQVISQKKAAVGGFNDEIKRIKAEIVDVVGDEAP